MLPITDSFEFDYAGTDVVYGRGCIGRLGALLAARGVDDALVVCGSNVGANDAVMDPLRAGGGDRLAGVFDETTPEKRIETVYAGVEAFREYGADAVVGVGGGSSLDIARQISVFAADGRPLSTFREAAREGRAEAVDPQDDCAPVIAVPTTFAGADISDGGAVIVLPAADSPTGQPIQVGGTAMPTATVHDPDLFETTPPGAIAGSAMNGFDKGIETVYTRGATPISDATAVHGLRLLRDAFPRLPDGEAMNRAVVGSILVQLERGLSVVHAFGHGFARRYPVQQGVVHAVLVPHALRYVLESVDARRELLAIGLGVDADRPDAEVVDGIVSEVTAVRDSFALPTRLRDVDPVDRDDFPEIAGFIVDDFSMAGAPPGLDPSAEEIEAVLRDAW